MKSLLVLPLFLLLAISCGSNSETTNTTQESTDTVAAAPDSIMFYQGYLEYGMEESFYMTSEGEETLTSNIREIHVVPQISEEIGNDSSTVCEFMYGIMSTNLDLYYMDIDSFSGMIRFYYDAYRTHPVTEFKVINGEPDGPVKVFSPEGDLMVSRVYEAGLCVATIQDVYAIDWKFNPSAAALEIEKFAAYKSTDADGNSWIRLGVSMYPSEKPYENSLDAMLEKPVFENVFTVNGQPYTGTLTGHYYYNLIYPMVEPQTYFELVFLDGKLHDTIRIYSDYEELMLEERFENGVFAETVYELDYSEMDGMAKPVIYLYPEKDMAVNVQLDLKGELTHSYPAYPQGGWNVLAKQNGTLYDLSGKEYYALFWEGVSTKNYTYSEGFVVKGSETAAFLENSLDVLGLTRREANEFIMYWLPQMENNAYNLVHFSTTEYAEIAALKITPKPASLIRIMMVWSPLEAPVEIPQQNLYDLRTERNGFTVVEWGGKQQKYETPS